MITLGYIIEIIILGMIGILFLLLFPVLLKYAIQTFLEEFGEDIRRI